MTATCWCGSDELEPAEHEAYTVCRSCGSATATELLTHGAAAMRERLAELYGESYWREHQTAHSMPTIEERARLDLGERCSYWTEHLLRYLPAPARVLEVGCGHGGLLKMLQLCGYAATGTEVDDNVASFGRQRFGVDVIAGRFEDHATSLGSYDGVLMFDVVEHLVDPGEAIDHVTRHLEPDGILAVQTPCHAPGLPADWPMYLPPEHTVLFSRESIRILLSQHGLEHVEFEPALFDYDMFVFASRVPLTPATIEVAQRRLEQTPDGRMVRALLEVAAENREARAATEALRADAVARAEATARLTAQVAELDGYAQSMWKSRWVRLGRLLKLTRTPPPTGP